MALNEQFFAAVRSGMYAGTISQPAVDGMNAICKAFDGFTGHDHCTDDLAAIIATCMIETGMDLTLSIREIGQGKGKAYGIVTGQYNQIYYGRGPCQITWLANYTTAQKRSGVNYVQFPDYMLDPKYGIAYMIDAMYAGLFTKKGLRNYITPGVPTTLQSFMSSRAIINGTDQAAKYGALCVKLQSALRNGYDKPIAPPVLPNPSTPVQNQGLLAWLRGLFHNNQG